MEEGEAGDRERLGVEGHYREGWRKSWVRGREGEEAEVEGRILSHLNLASHR
jgi:hypothetical protein